MVLNECWKSAENDSNAACFPRHCQSHYENGVDSLRWNKAIWSKPDEQDLSTVSRIRAYLLFSVPGMI